MSKWMKVWVALWLCCPAMVAADATFRVSGTGNGTLYTLTITVDGEAHTLVDPGTDGGPDAFVALWKTVFEEWGVEIMIDPEDPSVFTIKGEVTSVEVDDCEVVGNRNGCSFNPLLLADGIFSDGFDTGHTRTWDRAQPEPPPLTCDQLTAQLLSGNAAEADVAYGELWNQGAECVDNILDLTTVNGTFAGMGYQNERSSILQTEPPQIAKIAIYLLDGILRGDPAPHFAPQLLGDDSMDDAERLQLAVDIYRGWWGDNAGLSLADLQQLPNPLAEAAVHWHGPILKGNPAPAPNGTRRPGSATPIPDPLVHLGQPDGPDAGNDPDPYAWTIDGTPTPYNCLALAVGWHQDRWIQPDSVEGDWNRWKKILEDYGYDADSAVSCDGACPSGSGPKIKMIWHLRIPEIENDHNWVHAMKREADGEWESKNGSGSLWEDIEDCDAFIEEHYPAPEGKFVSKQCFCK